MLRIENHRLVGPDVSFRATPNVGGALVPRYLVMHYTAGRSLESSVESLCSIKPQGNASAHLVLGRDGRIVQLAPFDVVTWHAGVSHWNGLAGLNRHSIGIEMDNAGLLKRIGAQYVAWFGKPCPDNEVLLADHKHGGGTQPWHAYTEAQIERALELAELLVAHYGLEDVLGHDDIAPQRKADPGPAFPLGAVRSRALGRVDDVPARYRVTATSLNIRQGADARFDTVAPALKRGTELQLLEPGSRWSRVEVVGTTDIEGWVNNSFIERMAASAEPVPRSRAAARAAKKKPAARKSTGSTRASRASRR